jgi:coenzyme F420 hydrogenase subunit beta
MCAGVPGIEGTINLINRFGITPDEVKSLRYRGEGWPGKFKVLDKKGKTHKISYNESWGIELNKHLQFRCKICPDGTGEFSDISCADAWEFSKNGYPSFEEQEGKSLIITRTDIGQRILNEAVEKSYISIHRQDLPISEIEKMQPYQVRRKRNLIARLTALKLSGRRSHNYQRKLLYRAALKENPFRLLKNFLGMLKRL